MLEELRAAVLEANAQLPARGLVTLTWGNASGIDRDRGLMVIKPSGVAYEELRADDLVVLDLDGNLIEGARRPSTDTPTHLALYRALDGIGGIVHTHSTWATAWAQAQREIPLLGTTHADLSRHAIPVTRPLTEAEVQGDYEAATGTVIVEALAGRSALELPCVLVRGHAPFSWGATVAEALEHAITLEEVARMALLTTLLQADAVTLDEHVMRKHFARKHGAAAYYGQG